MSPSEVFAIAAHMHVLLRRKTGRVTDTEWLATNADYAREIVRFAREKAASDGHLELVHWANKLEAALPHMVAAARPTLSPKAGNPPKPPDIPRSAPSNGFADSTLASGFGESVPPGLADKTDGGGVSDTRYIGRLR